MLENIHQLHGLNLVFFLFELFLSCRVQEHGGEPIIPFSGALERDLADMLPDEAAKYCEENNVQRLVEIWIWTILYMFLKIFCLLAESGH